ncbi:MAG: hypothetical protein LBR83_04555 [Clostridiales bacterium]|jgi:hypothetical protein|nr:hypothetical protein [Clostridiales bacterium]
MSYFFQTIFTALNDPAANIVVMAVYICLTVFVILLRIVTCSIYRSSLFAFKLEAKDIRSRDDIKKMKNKALRRITADYIRIADKSVSRIPSSTLVDRQVDSLSLVGWRCVSVMPFVEALETGLLLCGVVLALSFGEYAFMYGVLSVGGFALIRLLAAFFDFRAARKLYADELLIYVEREVGHFYAADAGGAVLRLKDELSSAIAKQSAVLKESTDALAENIADAFERKIEGMYTALRETIAQWDHSVEKSKKAQEALNASAEKMQSSGANLQSASDLLSRHLQAHSDALTEHLSALVSAVEEVKASNEKNAEAQEILLKQVKFIEKNQQALDATVQAYETALQDLTESLSDGYGASLRLYAREAAATVNEALSANVERMSESNLAALRHMESLFEQLRDQSRDVSASLLSLHEKLGA